MKESYRKGVATILSPSHARATRKGALEALARGICRLGIPKVVSSEIGKIRESTVSAYPEDNRAARDNASAPCPAESKTPGMHRNFTRENREAPLPSVGSATRTAGRRR